MHGGGGGGSETNFGNEPRIVREGVSLRQVGVRGLPGNFFFFCENRMQMVHYETIYFKLFVFVKYIFERQCNVDGVFFWGGGPKKNDTSIMIFEHFSTKLYIYGLH